MGRLFEKDGNNSDQLVNVVQNTLFELQYNTRSMYDALLPEEKALVLECLIDFAEKEDPTFSKLNTMWEIDYISKPVDFKEYLRSDDHLGKYFRTATGDYSLWPKWEEIMCEIFAPGSIVNEWIITGSIGGGKTTVAALGMSYLMYRTCLLRDLHKYFGLMQGADITYGIYSITKDQGEDTAYAKSRSFIENSVFHQKVNCGQIDLERTSKIKFKNQPITCIFGSKEFHAIGKDIIAFLIDEVNFMETNKDPTNFDDLGRAYKLYDQSKTRLVSRFKRLSGVTPGLMFIVSSKKASTSFLEVQIEKSQDDIRDGKTIVSDFALWDINPKFKYMMKPDFLVQVGNEIHPSKILREGDDSIMPGCAKLRVPETFRGDFERNLEQALRDIAGVASYGVSPFMADRTHVVDGCATNIAHPFTRNSIISSHLNTHVSIADYFKPEVMMKIKDGLYIMKRHPEAPRNVHIDIAFVNDACGIAMTHFAGNIKQTKYRADGTTYTETVPIVETDFMIQLKAPKDTEGEIDQVAIVSFFEYLRELGVPIMIVSWDGAHSARGSINRMVQLGFESKHLSVDRCIRKQMPEAYSHLLEAHNEKRILVYPYGIYQKEIINLQYDPETGRVDHPEKNPDGSTGTKDIADALSGSHFHTFTDPRSYARMSDISLTDSIVGNSARGDSRAVSITPSSVYKIDWGKLSEEI